MTAQIIAPVSINGEPRTVGDVVELDANSFRNLKLKGRVIEYSGEQEQPKPRKRVVPEATT